MNYKTRQPFPHAAYVEGQRNFTYFDRSLTSGLTDVVIESPGDFLYIDQASTGVVSVELNMRQGGTLAPILLAAGGSIECDFASIKLTASAQLNKTVRVVVGNGARIKGGANVNASSMSVSVVDGGLARTMAQQCYTGFASKGAVAANLSLNQIWNPSTSGKNLFLESCLIMSPTAQVVSHGGYNAAYTTLGSTPMNKKIGGSGASVAQMRIQANATALYTVQGLTLYIKAAESFIWRFIEPVFIPPGYGYIVYGGQPNSDLTTSFEWYEE